MAHQLGVGATRSRTGESYVLAGKLVLQPKSLTSLRVSKRYDFIRQQGTNPTFSQLRPKV